MSPPPPTAARPPRVTMLMPVYNAARYVEETVASIQAQTFTDWELLAIDDGSTDDSAALLERLAATDRRIRLLRNPGNQGLIRTRNRGLDEASGEYVGWTDADDLSAPARLAKQVDFLDRHPDFGMVGSWVEEIDSEGRPNGARWILNAPPECVPGLMLFRCYCAQSAMLLRRADVELERYDPACPLSEDYEFNARLSRRLRMWNLPEILCRYRRHAASTSSVLIEGCQAGLAWLFRSQLAALGIVPADEELRLHTLLFNVHTRGAASLSSVDAWLCRLWQANAERRVYAPAAFARVLVMQWLYVCQAAPGARWSRLRAFAGGELLRLTRLSPARWVGLLAEAAQKAWISRSARASEKSD